MRTRDTIAALVLACFAGAASVESARLLPYGVVRNPGPGFFPWWTSLTLGLLSLVLLGQSLLARRPPSGQGAAERWRKVVGVLAVLALYALTLDTVGYPIATFLLVLFMLRVTAPHRWAIALGVALLAAGGSYLLFAVWLSVPLPAGPLAR
jgi:putative tricarboxylic transport membrane protein